MYLEMSKEQLVQKFEENLLQTNRGFEFYVDWANVSGLETYDIQLNALNALVVCAEEDFDDTFKRLLVQLPSVINVFPYLFGLAKAERLKVTKNSSLRIITSDIDSEDFGTFSFNGNAFPSPMPNEIIEHYLDFFEKMGLKNLFLNIITTNVIDYVYGVLVGLDSNGRKNRGGEAFELACKPIFERICSNNNLKLMYQAKLGVLNNYGYNVSADLKNRKADFIIIDEQTNKVLSVEVNFFFAAGSKPEEIIDSYINRQNEMLRENINFAFITDGQCWKGTTNQIQKGFRHLNYLMNFYLAKHGYLEEVIKNIFNK